MPVRERAGAATAWPQGPAVEELPDAWPAVRRVEAVEPEAVPSPEPKQVQRARRPLPALAAAPAWNEAPSADAASRVRAGHPRVRTEKAVGDRTIPGPVWARTAGGGLESPVAPTAARRALREPPEARGERPPREPAPAPERHWVAERPLAVRQPEAPAARPAERAEAQCPAPGPELETPAAAESALPDAASPVRASGRAREPAPQRRLPSPLRLERAKPLAPPIRRARTLPPSRALRERLPPPADSIRNASSTSLQHRLPPSWSVSSSRSLPAKAACRESSAP